ncbi:Outer membrane protein beta-barrel domain-containing protein [Roseateles sp. YR242]|uniref:porin family protein n=1 Tax=Roseateles sp. YR242 TaxID=1855305 RepID=UPI0008D8339B|nr:porin family protein [Roseateles sp. YR242]SEK84699.1 Outer membrane protein beta-barrel domain-containing protein [Roseateles sp. YR242]
MRTFVATCASAMVLTAALGASSDAHAEDPNPGLTPGVYGQFAIGAANGSNPNYDKSSTLSVAWGLGYRFTPNLGAEVFLRGLNFDINLFAPNRDYAYPERHVGVALTGSLPISSIFNVTGRAGIGQTTLKRDNGPDSTKTSASAGVGLALQLGSHMALTTGYERYAGVNVNVWNLGWELRY